MIALAMASGLPFTATVQAQTDSLKAAVTGKYKDISIADLKEAIEKGKVTVIDANGKKSFDSGRVPGAHHWAAVKDDFAKVLPEDKSALIVAYCSGPT